ncbi:AraC family transcriptional regulator [Cronobacter turicensis]|uniref:Arabinose operon regulatory protein n=2 Tax=Cronobacter turicensis TaxID=413502 RepID=A0A2T7B1N8_9ENTR|nr:AraC family transcriptional regulator [Cronobacter turicensis]PUX19341.1 AraC family transcriptional regulator [Cronobacter turicensis]PUX41090.1 AraC family transcriptional regulator [Cronobacter turicensis]
MITFCLNEHPPASGFSEGVRPRLAFICKAQGREEAIPRIMHKHDDRFEVMFIRSGRGVYNIDGRNYHVKQGDIILFNAHVLHDEIPEASDELLIYSCGVEQLKVDGLPLNVLTTRAQPAVMHSGDYYDEIGQLFEMMLAQVNRHALYSAEIGDNLLAVLLLLCRRLWSENSGEEESDNMRLGQRIKAYIDSHYKEEITLSSMTATINVNHFYLAHVFKDYSGYSPKHYQTRLRIGEAQNLLLSTRLGVTEIAHAVGYDNVNNFHRLFNNLVGISPARYKKLWLTGKIKR